MSTHEISIVLVGDIRECPNADSMELTDIWGWQCCIKKGQFKKGDKAVYVPPDYLVPTDIAEFAFLKRGEGRTHERITVRRFRGQLSQGLLVPVPKGFEDRAVGDNLIDELGILRYEPPQPKAVSADVRKDRPKLPGPNLVKFDVEPYQRHSRNVLVEGETLVVTEKIHGANARYVFTENDEGEQQFFVGSRNLWLKNDAQTIWNKVLSKYGIEDFCRAYPDHVLYGEVFGQVQDLKYGAGEGEVFFAAFAVLHRGVWIDYDTWKAMIAPFGIGHAPLLAVGAFTDEQLKAMAEQDSVWPGAKHLREGVVITPLKERHDPKIGRVCLKLVSNRYLSKA